MLITTSFPQRGDGSEAAGAFVADFAESMARHVPVRVVAPGQNEGEEVVRGIPVFRFAAPGRPLSLLSPSRPADWPAIVATLRSLRAQAMAAASDGRVGHTFAFWALPSGWAARQLQRKYGIGYSVWALGSDIWSLGRLPLIRSVLRGVIQDASHCFADGLQLGQDAERIGGRPFEFLPSTRRLEIGRKRPLASGPPYRLLFLGRWHPNKGTDILLEALSLLPDEDWGRISEVHIAGGGPLDEQVKSSVADLRGNGRPVRLSGYLDNAAACEALAEADYLLLPSRIESIPVVYSDAMKMQLPVVAMPVGDLPALLARHHAGELAAAVDAASFAAAVRRALSNPPTAYADGIAGSVAQFNVDPLRLRERFNLGGQSPVPGEVAI
ncbi:glycosyltransferase [Lysobacter sp. GCM10012299]|uniref:glycosyltransferase n=1 Tax=Lysobacter sp. GCM10012299 TaxID=3317333 RepID=UPI00361109A3